VKQLKYVLIVLFCLALIALLGYQMFRLGSVEVVGTDQREAVVAAMPIGVGDSLLRADTDEIRKTIDSNGQFICKEVQILWPNRLRVEVVHRVNAGYVESGGQYAVIGQDGYVLRIDPIRPDGLPEIRGLTAASFKVGSTMVTEQWDRLEALEAILGVMNERGCFDQISQINLIKTTWLTVTTYDGVICTLGMADQLDEKFAWIDAAMEKLRAMYTPQELFGCQLDVSTGNSAVFSAHSVVEDPSVTPVPTQTPEPTQTPVP